MVKSFNKLYVAAHGAVMEVIMEVGKTKNKRFEVPHTYVILFVLIIITCILTYIIPGGTYQTLNDGTIDANSFEFIENKPASLGDFLNSFMKGMKSASSTIFVCLFIGGAFQIVMDTGAIDAILAATIQKTKGNYSLIFPAVMFVMAVLGALGVGNNVALAFVPILISLARKLRLDAISVAAVLYISSNTGFTTSPMNPFTVLLAQDIAKIPQMSGIAVRSILFIVFNAFGIWYTIQYCNKIRKDSGKSLVGIYDMEGDEADELKELKPIHIINFIILLIVFIVYAYGGIKLGWGISQLGSSMMVLGIVVGIVSRMPLNKMCESFTKGAKTMLGASLVIGFASTISVVMTEAKIIHSIVYYVTLPLAFLPKALTAIGMYIVNFLIAIPISSGSGQAYVVMPLMAPAADILGVSRQIAISAYQFADGFANFITPTNGLMMGTIALAGVPYDKWLKYIGKYLLYLSILCSVFLFFASMLGWS